MNADRNLIGRRTFLGTMGAAGAAAGLVLFSGPTAAATTHQTTSGVVNGNFEAGLTGWTNSGTTAAAHLDRTGADGTGYRLTHWSDSAYSVVTSQRVSGLRPGWVTAGAWVKSGGALGSSTIELGDGRDRRSVTLPNTEQDDGWVYLAVSARINDSTTTVRLRTTGPAQTWANFDNVTVSAGRIFRDIRGADLSSVPKNEDHGAVYYDTRGRRAAPEQILAAAGANLGRLKVWVNPADGYNDKAHVIAMARRIKRAGMQLLVDFHYSDTWTDPGHQAPPEAWKNFTAPQMAQAVRQHTLDVLGALGRAGHHRRLRAGRQRDQSRHALAAGTDLGCRYHRFGHRRAVGEPRQRSSRRVRGRSRRSALTRRCCCT